MGLGFECFPSILEHKTVWDMRRREDKCQFSNVISWSLTHRGSQTLPSQSSWSSGLVVERVCSQCMKRECMPPQDKKGRRNQSCKCCSQVSSRPGAGQPDTPSRELAASVTPQELPCGCLGIILSAGLFIVHRHSSCRPRSCFCFVKRVPEAQGKKGCVERQETLKAGEENGFCQVVCTVPLLFSSSLLKIIALGL